MTGARPFWSPLRLALALGAASWLAVMLTLGDPGITSDEPLDVRPGLQYIRLLQHHGAHFFDRDIVTEAFADNAEHPPLGRWLLGVAAKLGEPLEFLLGGVDVFSVHAGRLAPALAFAILVGLVTHAAARRYGLAAGAGAGLSLVMMPRAFAHAHIAALDTFLCLFWTAALLAAVKALNSRRPTLAMAAAGVVWGLALLTKIHAWLLPPVILAYALISENLLKHLPALAVWGVTGLAVFALGWPWLWYDTPARLSAYLGTSVERAPIFVQYFGQVYRDRAVPWHYPWFYFAVTVPIGLQLLGALGIAQAVRQKRTDVFPLLLAGTIGEFLVLFSTRVPVYDGERLFLVTMPLWAILIGLGFQRVWQWTSSRRSFRVALVAAFACQAYGLVALHPFGLSYYNALVGGLPGAERLGLELTYWGDTIDGPLLDELAASARPGDTAALVPTLHAIQPTACLTPALQARQIGLLDESAAPGTGWILLYRRTAYWRPELARLLAQSERVAVRSRQGVWLGALWRKPLRFAPPAQRAAQPEKTGQQN